MATSAAPSVMRAVVNGMAPLETVRTSYGPQVTQEPGDYLMIGASDVDSEEPQDVVIAGQVWRNAGHISREEDATIACVAYSWNGDGDMGAAIDAVYAIAGAVETFLRADPTIGLNPGIRCEFGAQADLRTQIGATGAEAALMFQLRYLATI